MMPILLESVSYAAFVLLGGIVQSWSLPLQREISLEGVLDGLVDAIRYR